MFVDTYRHKGMRQRLAETVRMKGISDERVVQAIAKVPRHVFLDMAFVEKAYDDAAFPIGQGQTISQPFTVAYQTELLNPEPTERVLEVGTGSGYQACILAELVKEVYSIERIQSLSATARGTIAELGYKNIKLFHGDGNLGLPAFAPYDKILITAATPDFPDALLQQLKVGGVIVAPVGRKRIQQMVRLTKNEDGTFEQERFDQFQFVPMLPGKRGGK